MKKMVYLSAIMFALLSVCAGGALAYGGASPYGGVEGNINLLIGQKFVTDGADYAFEYDEVDEQAALGLMVDVKPAGLPFSVAIDFLKTEDTNEDYLFEFKGETQEIDLGIRFYTQPNVVRLYLGGGLALVEGKLTEDIYGFGSLKDDDETAGFWLNGGLVCTVARHLNLGVDLRYSRAEIKLFDETVDAGGVTVSGFIGFHF